jgi:hypothetical protein
MAAELLVDDLIADGQVLVDQLAEDGFDVALAFLARRSDAMSWDMYLAYPKAAGQDQGTAFNAAYAALLKHPDSSIGLSDIKLIDSASLAAQTAVAFRDRHPANQVTRYRGRPLGDLSIEDAYIYAPSVAGLRGFAEVRRHFPSARLYTKVVPADDFLKACQDNTMINLEGKVNEHSFEGMGPETVLFMGANSSSRRPTATLLFIHRPEGWNKVFRPDKQIWDEVVFAATGKKLFESADFAPLAALKAIA